MLVTTRLPAGSYVITGKTVLRNLATTFVNAICELWGGSSEIGGGGFGQLDVNWATAPARAATLPANFVPIAFTGSLSIPTPGAVSIRCWIVTGADGSNLSAFYSSITAVLVESLTR